eukprot:m.392819 g.392819  ORF g.392819 m.392819 type:complete len:325 (+) comp56353_c0_seq13:1378-2352(+)
MPLPRSSLGLRDGHTGVGLFQLMLWTSARVRADRVGCRDGPRSDAAVAELLSFPQPGCVWLYSIAGDIYRRLSVQLQHDPPGLRLSKFCAQLRPRPLPCAGQRASQLQPILLAHKLIHFVACLVSLSTIDQPRRASFCLWLWVCGFLRSSSRFHFAWTSAASSTLWSSARPRGSACDSVSSSLHPMSGAWSGATRSGAAGFSTRPFNSKSQLSSLHPCSRLKKIAPLWNGLHKINRCPIHPCVLRSGFPAQNSLHQLPLQSIWMGCRRVERRVTGAWHEDGACARRGLRAIDGPTHSICGLLSAASWSSSAFTCRSISRPHGSR